MKKKKNLGILCGAMVIFISCQKKTDTTVVDNVVVTTDMQAFGENFEANEVKSASEMAAVYASLNEGDTLTAQFSGEIEATCKKKGCWMSLDLDNGQKAIVRFKDYGFFVPKEGAEGKETIVNGKAFLAVTSVDQLKHDAKDAGKSQAAIDSITAPKVLNMFLADGVLIKK